MSARAFGGRCVGGQLVAQVRAAERIQTLKAETGFSEEICRRREPDDWMLHYTWPPEDHTRRTVIREGPLIVDVECRPDSEAEQGAERLARRAMRFLTDRAWRAAWLEGGRELLTSKDAGLRLATVTRRSRKERLFSSIDCRTSARRSSSSCSRSFARC